MHVPVLTQRIEEFLNPQPNQNFIDATLGRGGHTKRILEKNGPKGKVLAIDWDPEAIQRVANELSLEFKKRVVFVQENFEHLKDIVLQEKFSHVQGIIFDLGLSSEQLEDSKRGFSFQRDEILDMRFNPLHGLDAKKILNFWSRFDIEKILKEYGEERFAPMIAKEIVGTRSRSPVVKVSDLLQVIQNATPRWYQKQRLHPATKTFQALRIAVNHELESLQKALPQAADILEPGGRMAVISFHSLEDRIVKNFFKTAATLSPITKKPVIPSPQETKENPRARSAKLRIAEKKQNA
ncbi:MAG: 16S rRNA (cytosine(1402)-N(4))-methyltransferase RsmH [Candidatus Wildermuthbacteria bacterium]|nr:16S rRNA (cytosine(1402)-N(4))-methyltransferase RsmH [Candidatus Wildermuthbacteria bacterium]